MLVDLSLSFYILARTARYLQSVPGDVWCVTVFALAGGTVQWRAVSVSVSQFAVTASTLMISLILQTLLSKLSHLPVKVNVQIIINNKLNICYVIVTIRHQNCAIVWSRTTVQSAALCCCWLLLQINWLCPPVWGFLSGVAAVTTLHQYVTYLDVSKYRICLRFSRSKRPRGRWTHRSINF